MRHAEHLQAQPFIVCKDTTHTGGAKQSRDWVFIFLKIKCQCNVKPRTHDQGTFEPFLCYDLNSQRPETGCCCCCFICLFYLFVLFWAKWKFNSISSFQFLLTKQIYHSVFHFHWCFNAPLLLIGRAIIQYIKFLFLPLFGNHRAYNCQNMINIFKPVSFSICIQFPKNAPMTKVGWFLRWNCHA